MGHRTNSAFTILLAFLALSFALHAQEAGSGPLASGDWTLADTVQLKETIGYNYTPASPEWDDRSRLIISETAYGKIVGLDTLPLDEMRGISTFGNRDCIEYLSGTLDDFIAKPAYQCDIGNTVGMCSTWTAMKAGMAVHGACIGLMTKNLQAVRGTVILFGAENPLNVDHSVEAVLKGYDR